jgi:ABC-type nickel/cobalt efflux system permease component RcnA
MSYEYINSSRAHVSSVHPAMRAGAAIFALALLVVFVPAVAAQEAAGQETAARETADLAQIAGAPLPGLESSAGGRLAETISLLAGGGTARLWLLVLLYGALYGMIQALFIGHRKALLFSYFLAEDARAMQGVLAGGVVAFLQVGIAVGAVFLGRFALDAGGATAVADTAAWLQPATGALMAVLAVVLLVLRGLEYLRTRDDWHEEKYISKLRPLDKRIDPDNEDPAVQLAVAHARQLRRRRRAEAPWLPVAVIAALAPSPAAAAATSHALGLGSPMVALVAGLAVFLGLALTLIALSVVTIVVKERLIDVLGSRAAHFTHFGIEVAGAVAIFVLGGLLVTGVV